MPVTSVTCPQAACAASRPHPGAANRRENTLVLAVANRCVVPSLHARRSRCCTHRRQQWRPVPVVTRLSRSPAASAGDKHPRATSSADDDYDDDDSAYKTPSLLVAVVVLPEFQIRVSARPSLARARSPSSPRRCRAHHHHHHCFHVASPPPHPAYQPCHDRNPDARPCRPWPRSRPRPPPSH